MALDGKNNSKLTPLVVLDSMKAKYAGKDGFSGNKLFEQVIQGMKNLGWQSHPERVGACFIAGTPVHTDRGLVPIEQIKVGDLVLSQPEEQGERAYRRVTRTFVHDDAPIWVVKYMLIDGDVPWEHTNYMPKDETMHHCYVTGNHPFWVDGQGWTPVEELERYQILELASGQRAHIELIWPVIRSIEPGFGRVCSNMYAEGQEVHIVDFRNGSNLWKYRWLRHDDAPVPYQEGYPDDDLTAISDIISDPDPFFKTRVYNIEVEDFHTYYIGELGVWVHNKSSGLSHNDALIKLQADDQRKSQWDGKKISFLACRPQPMPTAAAVSSSTSPGSPKRRWPNSALTSSASVAVRRPATASSPSAT